MRWGVGAALAVVVVVVAQAGCGARRGVAPATGEGGAGGSDAGAPGDAPPSGTLTPISLGLPPELASRSLTVLGSGAAIAGEHAWISAQTADRTTSNNGPVLVYERSAAGAWRSATLPATTTAWYPDLCAAASAEAYVTVSNDANCSGSSAIRIFARAAGDAPVFQEQPGPGFPDGAAAGHGFQSLRLACFPGGQLIAYGGGCVTPGGDQIAPVIFRRASTGAPWVSVPVPAAQVGPPSTNGRISSALVRSDGSGYFSMPRRDAQPAIFERQADGSWVESFLPGNQVLEIVRLAGDPGGHAVGATIGLVLGYVDLSGGVWSFVAAPGFRSLRTVALSRQGLILGGAAGDPTLMMAVGREPAFVPEPIGAAGGLTGTVQAMAFPLGSSSGAGVLIAYGAGTTGLAWEWTP